MDTLYYRLIAKKVKVCGGADRIALVPQTVPPPSEGRGEVLDFERCCRRLETQNAWEALNQAAWDNANKEEPEPPIPQARSFRGMDWLEVCASVAVILVSLCAGAAFLRLL